MGGCRNIDVQARVALTRIFLFSLRKVQMQTYRIGQIVPSSNTTMETEIPAMLMSRYAEFPEQRFTFHSARMRMMKVTPEELKSMDVASDRCALELSDAQRA